MAREYWVLSDVGNENVVEERAKEKEQRDG